MAHRGPGDQLLGEGQVLLVEAARVAPSARSWPCPGPRRGPAAARRSASGCRSREDAWAAASGSWARQPWAAVRSASRTAWPPASAARHRRRGGRRTGPRSPDRVERVVVADAARPPCGASRVSAPERFLAAQHRLQQIDGDEVGEPRDRHLRQLLGGARTSRVVPIRTPRRTAASAAPAPPRPGRTARAARWCPAASRRCPALPPYGSVGRMLTASSRSPARCTSSVAARPEASSSAVPRLEAEFGDVAPLGVRRAGRAAAAPRRWPAAAGRRRRRSARPPARRAAPRRGARTSGSSRPGPGRGSGAAAAGSPARCRRWPGRARRRRAEQQRQLPVHRARRRSRPRPRRPPGRRRSPRRP